MLSQTIATDSLVTITFAIAVFGAVSMFGDQEQRQLNGGLIVFLAVAAFDALAVLVDLWEARGPLLWIGRLEPVVIFLYGPSIYLYVLRVTGKTPPFRRAALLYAGPMAVALPLFGAAAMLPRDVQVAMVASLPMPDSVEGERAAALMIAMQASFVAITFGFLVACWRVLDDNLRRVGSLFSSIEDRTLNWLRVVIVLIFFAWMQAALQPLLAGFYETGGWSDAVDAGVTLSWVAILVYFGIRQHSALQEPAPRARSLPGDDEVPEKYARSALSADRMRQLGDRMTHLMQRDALHRDPSLSLRRLAEHVGASPNYVSQTLNDHLGVSFFDFVNGFRVDEAEQLMRTTDRTFTEIALDVGFNSRSTFNSAVRKHRGTSPTALRKR
ncbi:AraC-type DNA-binding protein [Pseudooceanicola antarcticus]|nr:AraC family transcriptional regulator [Pseudooceanicola antarcticus]SNY47982.1 AraC-type DNA-binding protein [Pseudooceanicola antarcticus]